MDKRKEDRSRRHREPSERPIIPLPMETLVDVDMLTAAEMRKKSAVDEAFEEFERKGALTVCRVWASRWSCRPATSWNLLCGKRTFLRRGSCCAGKSASIWTKRRS
ncbi:hypothetical protein LJK88_02250 [Paenibacillus sp. P26]|nr:hypothetical protein LJK88_02250 [Paenibacillus sp. P26]